MMAGECGAEMLHLGYPREVALQQRLRNTPNSSEKFQIVVRTCTIGLGWYRVMPSATRIGFALRKQFVSAITCGHPGTRSYGAAGSADAARCRPAGPLLWRRLPSMMPTP